MSYALRKICKIEMLKDLGVIYVLKCPVKQWKIEKIVFKLHHTNYQKRIRFTFVNDYFDEKWE